MAARVRLRVWARRRVRVKVGLRLRLRVRVGRRVRRGGGAILLRGGDELPAG